MVWWVGRVNIEVSLIAIKSIKTFSIELTSMSNLNCLFDRYYSTRNNEHFRVSVSKRSHVEGSERLKVDGRNGSEWTFCDFGRS